MSGRLRLADLVTRLGWGEYCYGALVCGIVLFEGMCLRCLFGI